MKNSFTYKNYIKVLKKAKKNGFRFSKFSKNFDKKSKVILLRHDIDLSLEKALKMAEMFNENSDSGWTYEVRSGGKLINKK